MKFVVKLIDAPAVLGGKAYALHDADTGEILPGQLCCTVETGVNDRPFVRVELGIDGIDVSLT